MRLKARFAFNVPGVGYVTPGAEFDVPDAVGASLMAAQANHFEQVREVANAALDAPPADKMVRKYRVRTK